MRYVVFVFAVLGALFGTLAFLGAKGAPQEAAAAAVACAMAVVPYVIYRVFQITEDMKVRREFYRRALAVLEGGASRPDASSGAGD